MQSNSHAQRFFTAITAKPKTVISLGVLLIIVFASFIPTLQKDTRSDAFIPEDHPALVFRDQTKALFGLEDPLVIAVIAGSPYFCESSFWASLPKFAAKA